MDKALQVERLLSGYERVLVAFSGGVDSSLLLALALRALGAERVLAVTASGVVGSADDAGWADSVAAGLHARHMVLPFDYLGIPGFVENPPDRCYLCRRELYLALAEIGESEGIDVIVDGVTGDDSGDYRPGMRAGSEAGVLSPLAEVGLTKQEVRAVSRELGLSVADRPASPCLASRFPYGEHISEDALGMVAQAEAFLRARGFPVCRVRHHGTVARIEVPVEELERLCAQPLRGQVDAALRDLGYAYVCLDLRGFRSGSLNEVL